MARVDRRGAPGRHDPRRGDPRPGVRPGPGRPARLNPRGVGDELLRELERAWRGGDAQAAERLVEERLRRGLWPRGTRAVLPLMRHGRKHVYLSNVEAGWSYDREERGARPPGEAGWTGVDVQVRPFGWTSDGRFGGWHVRAWAEHHAGRRPSVATSRSFGPGEWDTAVAFALAHVGALERWVAGPPLVTEFRDPFPLPRQPNPDDRLRRLERAAASGDAVTADRLHRELVRAGRAPSFSARAMAVLDRMSRGDFPPGAPVWMSELSQTDWREADYVESGVDVVERLRGRFLILTFGTGTSAETMWPHSVDLIEDVPREVLSQVTMDWADLLPWYTAFVYDLLLDRSVEYRYCAEVRSEVGGEHRTCGLPGLVRYDAAAARFVPTPHDGWLPLPSPIAEAGLPPASP